MTDRLMSSLLSYLYLHNTYSSVLYILQKMSVEGLYRSSDTADWLVSVTRFVEQTTSAVFDGLAQEKNLYAQLMLRLRVSLEFSK